MYTVIWSKYLPIIRILLKRAVNAEQVLDLNRIDFERAGSARKAGYKFMIELNKGRVGNIISGIPLAADLAFVMQNDEATKPLLLINNYTLHLNTKFKLTIKCTSIPKIAEEVQVTETTTIPEEKRSGETLDNSGETLDNSDETLEIVEEEKMIHPVAEVQ
jgi:hypothetical protein